MSATVPPGQQPICEPGPTPEPQPLTPERHGSPGQQAILFDWFGTDPVNYEPVSIAPGVGEAVAVGLLCVRPYAGVRQNGSDGAESDGGPETVQDTPDCHHEPVWYESGTCMACEPAGRGSEERNVERELTRDAAGGILP